MKNSANEIKEYLTSLWYDASYSNSDQTKGIEEPACFKEIPINKKRIDLIDIDQLRDLCKKSAFETIFERRSIRKFQKDEAIKKNELSYLLFCTQGIKDKNRPRYRTSPTGGAKCSIETYIYIDNAENIEPGLYLYLPMEHKLVNIHNRNTDEFKRCLYPGNYFYSPITFIWTTIPYRLEWKYVERSYKILLLDAGHTCQNLYIACHSIGLGTCAVGAYRQKEMDSFLEVDGDKEFSVYCAPVGKPIGNNS